MNLVGVVEVRRRVRLVRAVAPDRCGTVVVVVLLMVVGRRLRWYRYKLVAGEDGQDHRLGSPIDDEHQ